MPGPPAIELLRAQLAETWRATRWTLDGLDDDEWAWEPVPGCWSVRPRASATRGWGRGDHVCEDAWPAPDPLPVTTIAWRIAHTAAWTEVYRDWTFGSATAGLEDCVLPGDAAGSVAWLFAAQDRFADAFAAIDDDAIAELRPIHYGARMPIARLVTIILDEHRHHCAEIGVLRDLRRGTARSQPMPQEPAEPSWWTAR